MWNKKWTIYMLRYIKLWKHIKNMREYFYWYYMFKIIQQIIICQVVNASMYKCFNLANWYWASVCEKAAENKNYLSLSNLKITLGTNFTNGLFSKYGVCIHISTNAKTLQFWGLTCKRDAIHGHMLLSLVLCFPVKMSLQLFLTCDSKLT